MVDFTKMINTLEEAVNNLYEKDNEEEFTMKEILLAIRVMENLTGHYRSIRYKREMDKLSRLTS